MAENIEIKARCSNYLATHKIIKRIATEYRGCDVQKDTYYCVKKGRLKLRESQLDGAYLIPYVRPDRINPTRSFYAKINIENPVEVDNLFRSLFGVHTVVRKKREIYLYENVRIHLDTVDLLGEFIELEAVLSPQHPDPRVEKKKVNYLMHEFEIKKGDLIAESYETLMTKLSKEMN